MQPENFCRLEHWTGVSNAEIARNLPSLGLPGHPLRLLAEHGACVCRRFCRCMPPCCPRLWFPEHTMEYDYHDSWTLPSCMREAPSGMTVRCAVLGTLCRGARRQPAAHLAEALVAAPAAEGVQVHPVPVQLQDGGGHRLQERAVVRDQDQAAARRPQPPLRPLDCLPRHS